MSKHILIAATEKPVSGYWRDPRARGVIIATFPTWAEAIAGWQYVDDLRINGEVEGVKWLAVRSEDDPQWKNAGTVRGRYYGRGQEPEKLSLEEQLWRLGRRAEGVGREWREKQIGQDARRIMAAYPSTSFHKLADILDRELTAQKIPHGQWEALEALKSRALVGRCWTCDRAYWMPKKQGPLHKARCSVCGGSLNQTTLSLRRHFHRLPEPTFEEQAS